MGKLDAATLLRRLEGQLDAKAFLEACMAAEGIDPSTLDLRALALAHAGMAAPARQQLATIVDAALDVDARVDLAAVHLALGEVERALAILETLHSENDRHPLLLARLAW